VATGVTSVADVNCADVDVGGRASTVDGVEDVDDRDEVEEHMLSLETDLDRVTFVAPDIWTELP